MGTEEQGKTRKRTQRTPQAQPSFIASRSVPRQAVSVDLCLRIAARVRLWLGDGRDAVRIPNEISVEDSVGLTRKGEFADTDAMSTFLRSATTLAGVELEASVGNRYAFVRISSTTSCLPGLARVRSESDEANVAFIAGLFAFLDVPADEPQPDAVPVATAGGNTTTRSKELRIAFRVSAEDLATLSEIVQECGQNVDFRVEFSDGSSTKCSAVDDVIRLPNSDRRITGIQIQNGWSGPTRATVRLRQVDHLFLEPARYEVTGDERNVAHVAARLDEALAGMREWYTRVAFVDTFFLAAHMLGAAFVAALAFFVARAYLTHDLSRKISNTETVRDHVIEVGVGAGMASIFLLGAIGNRIRGNLFPIGTFLIGHGIARDKRLTNLRQYVGGTLLLGMIASAVAGLLLR